jgi:predicted extracellular nuclease
MPLVRSSSIVLLLAAGLVPAARAALIGEIQGASHVSPFQGQSVTTSGVITAIANSGGNGFWIQDAGDGNAATSDGLFVFTSTRVSNLGLGLAVGDRVNVTGTVFEFRPGCSSSTTLNNLTCAPSDSAWKNLTITELVNPTIAKVSAGNALPGPLLIGGVGGLTAPTAISYAHGGSIESAAYQYRPTQQAIDFYESMEGMRVRVSNPQAVGPTRSFGEIVLMPDNRAGALLPTPRGGVNISAGDFNSARIHIDDRLVGFSNVPQVAVGTSFASMTGVIDYSFANYKLLVTENPVIAQASTITREVLPATPPRAGRFTVAGFNVENLGGNAAAAKYAGLAGQIVNNLRAPDILALSEVQDNNGQTNNGVVSASASFANLIVAINAAGGPTYQFRQIDPINNADGGAPGGNIRVGFLYRTDRVSFADKGAASANDATQVNADGSISLSPGRVDPANPAFSASRKPLAGEFIIDGERVIVVANHMNSKGPDDPLFGRFQTPVLTSEVQRMLQAEAVGSFVEGILARDPAARVVVLGDVNDFEFSNPLARLKAAGLSNLNETLPANERYTYLFDGNSQSLDHMLVSASLAHGAQVDIVHFNAEFPDGTRFSDHDAVFASLSLAPVPEPQTYALMVAGLGLVGWAARRRAAGRARGGPHAAARGCRALV